MTSDGTPLRVLILEDRELDAELLVLHLRKAGYHPDWLRVDSEATFSAAVVEQTWDVILADYALPHFIAPNALAIVKEQGLDVPFIIISGSVGEAAAVEAMKAGAHDFFLKDNLARLAAAVERERGEARIRSERREALKELEESQLRLRDAVRARDEFLSIASHELKTPLTSLSLQVESAQRILEGAEAAGGSAGRLKTKLAAVSRQVTRLTTLINSLLDVTRITSERMSLLPEAFDLREAMDSVLASAHEQIEHSGSTVDVRADAPCCGRWDRLRIESVILNLVANAIKYGAGQPIAIGIDIVGDQARLVVTDHGIGIHPEAENRIFRRFERAVPPEHFGGFGLGLWVVREIVEAHGGTISVQSSPDAGSTFTVLLPLQPPGEGLRS